MAKRIQGRVFAYNQSFEQTLETVSALRGEAICGAAQFNRYMLKKLTENQDVIMVK